MKSHHNKIQKLLNLAESNGVSEKVIFAPLERLLFKLGFKIRPFVFLTAIESALFFSVAAEIVFFVCVILSWEKFHLLGFLEYGSAGLVCGLVVYLIFSGPKRKKLKLPPWGEF